MLGGASFRLARLVVPPIRSATRLAAASYCRPFSTSRLAATDPPKIMLEDDKAFGFIRHNPRPPKPRKIGVTEIRGPYYAAMGKRYLEDVLET